MSEAKTWRGFRLANDQTRRVYAFFTDYQFVNDTTVCDVYPTPRSDDTLASIGVPCCFTTLCLRSWYTLGKNQYTFVQNFVTTRQTELLFRYDVYLSKLNIGVNTE